MFRDHDAVARHGGRTRRPSGGGRSVEGTGVDSGGVESHGGSAPTGAAARARVRRAVAAILLRLLFGARGRWGRIMPRHVPERTLCEMWGRTCRLRDSSGLRK